MMRAVRGAWLLLLAGCGGAFDREPSEFECRRPGECLFVRGDAGVLDATVAVDASAAFPDATFVFRDASARPDGAPPPLPDAGPPPLADGGLPPPRDASITPHCDGGTTATTAASPFATLRELDRNLDVSMDGLEVVGARGNGSARTDVGQIAGRWYFEATVSSGGGGVRIGADDLATPYDVGTNAYGCVLGTALSCGYGSERVAGTPALVSGSVVGVAVDLDARRAFFRHDGVWLPGQDPASEAGRELGWDPRCAPLRPGVRVASGERARLNFGASPFAHAAPSGFTAGWLAPQCNLCGLAPEPMSCGQVPSLRHAQSRVVAGCSGEPSNYRGPFCPSGEVVVLGVYEAVQGAITVRVRATAAPLTLVLSSYSPVIWTLELDPGATIPRVFLASRGGSRVESFDGSVVATSIPYLDGGYAWELSRTGGRFAAFIERTRGAIGATETEYQGCYAASSFDVPLP